MIKYKVVQPFTRTSIGIPPEDKYAKKYKKGTKVEAKSYTLGIFVFKRRKDAEFFERCNPGIIIRVKPIGRGKTPKYRINTCHTKYFDLRRLRRAKVKALYIETLPLETLPPGTICYPAVEVLD